MMWQNRRVELIRIIKTNKTWMTNSIAKNILEQYWRPNEDFTFLNAEALFEYLDQDIHESLQIERDVLLARVAQIDIELEKMRSK